MPRPRFKKLPEEKQRLILDTAASQFAERGFADASYNSIIEKCGLSKGVMYYYFDDKRDLYDTIVAEATAGYLAALSQWKAPADRKKFWRQIERLFQESLDFFAGNPRAATLVMIQVRSPELLDAIYRDIEESGADWFKRVLSDGQKVGAVREDLPMDLLIGITLGLGRSLDSWMLSRWEDASESDIKEAMDISLRLFKQTLLPQASQKS